MLEIVMVSKTTYLIDLTFIKVERDNYDILKVEFYGKLKHKNIS